jgi:hypothetical protein
VCPEVLVVREAELVEQRQEALELQGPSLLLELSVPVEVAGHRLVA